MARRWDPERRVSEAHPSLFEREDLGPRSIFTGKHLQSVTGDGASQQAPTTSPVATGAPAPAGTETPGEVAQSPPPGVAPFPSGADLRDEGMAKVLRVDDVWNGRAEALIRHLAQTGETFTAEDISDRLGLPEHRNACGALIRSLAVRGVIEKTGAYVASQRPERRRGMQAVWKGVG